LHQKECSVEHFIIKGTQHMGKSGLKIIIPGGAGLVGQNLVAQLIGTGMNEIVVLDKHVKNMQILKKLHPSVICECIDLANTGSWQKHFQDADVVVMLQAQIGGISEDEFERNNIKSTENVLQTMKDFGVARLVHISSSVVESVANDWYTNTKKRQEEIVSLSELSVVTLRPTLMFGWFDRKHLGWLSRFMSKTPIFPIPGNGRYMRQPLYAGDLCQIIISCINNRHLVGPFNISGQEEIDYIDIIRKIRKATNSHSMILRIPKKIFGLLLSIWAIWDKNPPFTNHQLNALLGHDEFEVIDWPTIFNVRPTPLTEAIDLTFNHELYSKIVLEF